STTIDTLDYSGGRLNEGSKVVIAAVGPPVRSLPDRLPAGLRLPEGFSEPRVALPGVLVVENRSAATGPELERVCAAYGQEPIGGFPLVVVVDDSEFAARSLGN